MTLFLVTFVADAGRGYRIATSAGFYLFIGAYAAQRFSMEFIKPYGTIIGPFNLFHLICLGLLGYAWSYGRAELRHGLESPPLHCSRQTTSMCETCLRLVPAKIIEQEGAVWYQKRCADHGVQKTLISSDARYWKRCRDFLKPGDLPLQFQTRIVQGCPYDCGLCPDHEQHSCLALIEINETCNLTCPTCFAGSSPALPGNCRSPYRAHARHVGCQRRRARSVADQRRRADPAPGAVRDHRRRKAPQHPPPDAEHQWHPHRDRARFRRAARRMHAALRGLSAIRRAESGCTADNPRRRSTAHARNGSRQSRKGRPVDHPRRYCAQRVNDGEIGDVLRHAAQWRCVRGVNFQPVQDTGRNEGFVPSRTALC